MLVKIFGGEQQKASELQEALCYTSGQTGNDLRALNVQPNPATSLSLTFPLSNIILTLL